MHTVVVKYIRIGMFCNVLRIRLITLICNRDSDYFLWRVGATPTHVYDDFVNMSSIRDAFLAEYNLSSVEGTQVNRQRLNFVVSPEGSLSIRMSCKSRGHPRYELADTPASTPTT